MTIASVPGSSVVEAYQGAQDASGTGRGGADETQKHPHAGAGTSKGGQFTSTKSTGSSSTAHRGKTATTRPKKTVAHHGNAAAAAHHAAQPAPHRQRTMHRGASGPDVAALNAALARLNLRGADGRPLAPSDQYGPDTVAAVMRAQQLLGLKPTGRAGSGLMRRLKDSAALSPCLRAKESTSGGSVALRLWRVTERWVPGQHPRGPGGKFRTVVDRLKDALDKHVRSGRHGDDPFAGFSRDELMRASRSLKLAPLQRGASREDYVDSLVGHLSAGSGHNATYTRPIPHQVFGNTTQSKAVILNGQDIGTIHEGPTGWLAFGATNSGVTVTNQPPNQTEQQAMDALIAAHTAGAYGPPPAVIPGPPPAPSTAGPAPTITMQKIPARHGYAASTRVLANGQPIGNVNRNHTGGGWTATAGNHNYSTHTTRKAAVDALIAAQNRQASAPNHTALAIEADLRHWVSNGQTNPDPLAAFSTAELHTAAVQLGLNPSSTTRASLNRALMAHGVAKFGVSAPASPSTAPGALPAPMTMRKMSPTLWAVSVGGTHAGTVVQQSTGGWQAQPTPGSGLPSPLPAGPWSGRVKAGNALAAAVRGGSTPAAPSAPATPVPVDPVVKAAQAVLYGTDPKHRTAARQLSVYGDLRRSHFDSLSPAEQSTVFGDLSYIASTSQGPNRVKAQKLIDRFTPPGTPAGTIPTQAISVPAGAATHQTRVADPAGTPGLLRMRVPAARGKNGDGWTRAAGGGTGPWGQYGAAGLMLRHVDSTGTERFLMVERGPGISDPGKWQFPGGAKDEKETFHEGAAREVVEELGFKATDLDAARVHGTHTAEVASVTVPGLHGGRVPWAYVSIAATVPTQLKPDLSTHHAQMETSDATWMTRSEIDALDRQGKLLGPLAGGKLQQNVLTLFPPTSATHVAGPTRPARLTGTPSVPVRTTAHKPSKGKNLVATKGDQDKLRADVAATRKTYRGKTADERLAAIGAIQGYDETPTVVARSEFDRLLATGDYIEAWRGVKGTSHWSSTSQSSVTKSAAQIAEEMRSGPAYYGTGIFGNGYYLATEKSIAQQYADSTRGSMIRILIPKAAKTETFSTVHGRVRSAASSTGYSYRGNGSSSGQGTLHDEGRYAAAVGLDGIENPHTAVVPGVGHTNVHAARPGRPTYTWVNRSVLIIEEAQ